MGSGDAGSKSIGRVWPAAPAADSPASSAFSEALQNPKVGYGRAVITVSRTDERSWESSELQNGYFTYDSVDCSIYSAGPTDFRHRAVVIGEDSKTRDRHELFDQDVSRVYLQANLIESLLDNRYRKPVGQGEELTAFFLCFIFVQAIFYHERMEPCPSPSPSSYPAIFTLYQ
jgi:hypothetical protein